MNLKTQPQLVPSAPLTANVNLGTALTKAAAFRLYQTLSQLKGLTGEPRHVYALVLIRKRLQALAEAIEEMAKPPERIQQLEQRRQTLCKEYADKDANGNPSISADNNYIIQPGRRAQFEAQLQSLQQDFKADIDAFQANIKRVTAFTNEPADVGDLPTIPISAISAHQLTVDQMDALFPILADDLSLSAK